jgi:hypothetical protein
VSWPIGDITVGASIIASGSADGQAQELAAARPLDELEQGRCVRSRGARLRFSCGASAVRPSISW